MDYGLHYHTCQNCGHSWAHNPGPLYSQWMVDTFHTCQRCRTITVKVAGLGAIPCQSSLVPFGIAAAVVAAVIAMAQS